MIKILFTFLLIASLAYGQGSGSALSFDGIDDYVDCGDITALNATNAFTVSGWFTQTTLDQRRNMWVKTAPTDIGVNNGVMIRARTWSDGRLYTYIENVGNNWGSFDYSNYVAANEWFHYTCVYDGTQTGNGNRLKVYINGQPVPLTYSVLPIPASTPDLPGRPFQIGVETFEGDNDWNGSIDEFTIWNRALSADEIRHSMCESLSGSEPGLIAYYRMDQDTCAPSDVCDASGNGNHGTRF